MNDLVIATIRTVVPSFVGIFVALMSSWGLHIDEAGIAGLSAFLLSLCIGAYYLAVRLLAKRFPQLEWLLGANKKPEYTESQREL